GRMRSARRDRIGSTRATRPVRRTPSPRQAGAPSGTSGRNPRGRPYQARPRGPRARLASGVRRIFAGELTGRPLPPLLLAVLPGLARPRALEFVAHVEAQ